MPVFRPLLLVLALFAATAVPVRPEGPEAITGAVLDAAGRPVAGAEVWLMSLSTPVEEWERQLAAGPTTTTGADGRFRLPRPAPIPESTALYVCRSGLRTGFELVGPDSPGPFLFRLEPAAVLAVRVLDPQGRPVADAGLFLSVPGEHPGCLYPNRVYPCETGGGRTGPDGRFVLDFLPPGWYEVSTSPAGYLRAESPATRLKAGERADIELRLGAGAAVAGRVHTVTGEPAAGVQVCADGYRQCGVTVADGSYRLTGLVPQPAAEVRAMDLDRGEARREVEIVAPETRVDLILDGRPGRHRVQGRLLGLDDTPLPGRALDVWAQTVFVDGPLPASTVTSADGSFELRLAPGSYIGSVRQPDGSAWAAVPDFDVGNRPRRLDLRLASGTIEGRVLGLAPGETAEVELPRGAPAWTDVLQIGPDGRYRFSGVQDGSWTLTATAGDRVAQGQVEVSGGGTARRDLVFRPVWEVSGRILDLAGRPAPEVEIHFRSERVFEVRSGADGSFSLLLEAGDYQVVGGGQGPFQPLAEIAIADGGATGLELRLPPLVALAGRVLGLAPGEQAELTVILDSWVSRTREEDGRYRFSDLAAGAWSVGVEVRAPSLPSPAGRSYYVPVEIPAGRHEVDFDIELPRGPYGIAVAADRERIVWLRSSASELRAWTYADRYGLFRFSDLPAGRYSLGTSRDPMPGDLEIELGEGTGREIRLELPPRP